MSYGTNAPSGFIPVSHINGSTYNGQTQDFYIQNGYANSLYQYMPLRLQFLAATGIGGGGNYVAPHPGDNSQPVLGILAGVQYILPQGLQSPSQLYWPANTTLPNGAYAIAKVIIDPTVVYTVQSAGGATQVNSVQFTSIGQNYAVVNAGDGNNATGTSTAGLNIPNAGAGGNATFPFKVIGLDGNPNNRWGQVYNNALVTINNSYFNGGTASSV